MSSGTSLAIRAVWGSSPVDAYAVGDSGLVLRYDGSAWRRLPGAGTPLLIAAWGEPGQGRVYAAGTLTTIVRGERQ
jgi:hypothetical protein